MRRLTQEQLDSFSYTVAELWASLDTAQRRQYLLDCGVKIFAAGRDPEGWRIAGDTSHAARGGWSELVVTEDLPGGAPGHRGC